jgi:Flp pilus assembly protein TadD
MVASERAFTSARRWLVRLIVVTALCTAVPGHAVESDTDPEAAADPDYAAGRKAIATENWNAAIKSFTSAAQRAPDNADIQNYLGYAHRKGGQLDTAFRHYKRALELNPRHKGAHEYIGEAYLMAGDPASARKHLEELRNICLLPCEELSDLEKALAEYRAKPRTETR